MHLEVNPQGAFAGAALLVAAVALAFALGRRTAHVVEPPRPKRSAAAGIPDNLEDAQRRQPIQFQDLEIDRGGKT